MNHYSTDKDINRLVRELVAAHAVIAQRGTRHWQLQLDDGRKLTVPGSPSDWRAVLNFKSDVRRFVHQQEQRV